MNDKSLELLKNLTEIPGVSGFEGQIRITIKEYLEPLECEMQTDNIGSLVVYKQGNQSNPKIMVASHMDEVGFMVTRITKDGFIKFQPLGGWWSQVLLSQRVEILTSAGKVIGVIGAKPPHILTKEEREKLVKIKDLFIDIGATSEEEVAKTGIKPGDPIIPYSKFEKCQISNTFMAKAIDNRAGCAMTIEVLEALNTEEHPNAVYGVMTVQEEVGARGAITSAAVVNPDLAIVLDVTVATDTPGISDNDVSNKSYLGKGPSIGFYDAGMIPNISLRDLAVQTAVENKIPYQIDIMPGGGTDADRIDLYKQGVPSVVIGIPVRYIHDHVAIANLNDYHNAVELIIRLIKKLDNKTVEALK